MLDITLLTALTSPQALCKPLRHKAQEETGSVHVCPGAARASLMHYALYPLPVLMCFGQAEQELFLPQPHGWKIYLMLTITELREQNCHFPTGSADSQAGLLS